MSVYGVRFWVRSPASWAHGSDAILAVARGSMSSCELCQQERVAAKRCQLFLFNAQEILAIVMRMVTGTFHVQAVGIANRIGNEAEQVREATLDLFAEVASEVECLS